MYCRRALGEVSRLWLMASSQTFYSRDRSPMDNLLKELIVHNKLALTLLAIFFTPVGVLAFVRLLRAPALKGTETPPTMERVEQIEADLALMRDELARLNE